VGGWAGEASSADAERVTTNRKTDAESLRRKTGYTATPLEDNCLARALMQLVHHRI
jgi:hypothetical protein